MDKVEIARRQLGTALQLFLQDKDPVSVHCLACGGGEIAEWLAGAAGKESFASHVMESFPELAANKLRQMRNLHWNAFKHASTRDGQARQDEALFTEFDPDANEHWLFIGWYDYGQAGLPKPVEAQVFETWWFAKYPDKANPTEAESLLRIVQRVFPHLAGRSRNQQRASLLDECRKRRKDIRLLADPLTDPRLLLLP